MGAARGVTGSPTKDFWLVGGSMTCGETAASSSGVPQLSQNLLPGATIVPHFLHEGMVHYHVEYNSEALYYNSENKQHHSTKADDRSWNRIIPFSFSSRLFDDNCC